MRLLPLVLLIAFPSTCLAEIGTGVDLLRQCKLGVRAVDGEKLSPQDLSDGKECLNYLGGFLDADSITKMKVEGKQAFCLPETGVSVYQTARVIVKWQEDNPQHLHKDRRLVLLSALSEAFPCSKK